jgi:hypothetical protein
METVSSAFFKKNTASFGKIINIFTVNDPCKNINEYFIVVNLFEINKSFMSDWPHLNIYQARETSQKVIITCEDIDCHCAFYKKNSFFLLTKLDFSYYAD